MKYYDLLIENFWLFFIIMIVIYKLDVVKRMKNILNKLKNKKYKGNIETYVGNLKVATDLDKKKAAKYAMKEMCEKKGYLWIQGGDEFIYDCKHSKTTCERDSIYPTPDTDDAIPQYYEWRDIDSEEAQEAAQLGQEFSTAGLLSSSLGQSANISNASDILNKDIVGGLCILGNEHMRKLCTDEGLKYDKTNGKCFTTKEYCYNRWLAYCDGDCFKPPTSYISEKLFGTTIGRTLAQASVVDQLIKFTCPGSGIDPSISVCTWEKQRDNIPCTLMPCGEEATRLNFPCTPLA